MLDKEDLQAIAELINGLREEMKEEMKASEQRTQKELASTRNELITYIDNTVGKDIKVVAEGIKTLNDRLPNLDTIHNVQERLSEVELRTHANAKEIEKLKKAQ